MQHATCNKYGNKLNSFLAILALTAAALATPSASAGSYRIGTSNDGSDVYVAVRAVAGSGDAAEANCRTAVDDLPGTPDTMAGCREKPADEFRRINGPNDCYNFEREEGFVCRYRTHEDGTTHRDENDCHNPPGYCGAQCAVHPDTISRDSRLKNCSHLRPELYFDGTPDCQEPTDYINEERPDNVEDGLRCFENPAAAPRSGANLPQAEFNNQCMVAVKRNGVDAPLFGGENLRGIGVGIENNCVDAYQAAIANCRDCDVNNPAGFSVLPLNDNGDLFLADGARECPPGGDTLDTDDFTCDCDSGGAKLDHRGICSLCIGRGEVGIGEGIFAAICECDTENKWSGTVGNCQLCPDDQVFNADTEICEGCHKSAVMGDSGCECPAAAALISENPTICEQTVAACDNLNRVSMSGNDGVVSCVECKEGYVHAGDVSGQERGFGACSQCGGGAISNFLQDDDGNYRNACECSDNAKMEGGVCVCNAGTLPVSNLPLMCETCENLNRVAVGEGDNLQCQVCKEGFYHEDDNAADGYVGFGACSQCGVNEISNDLSDGGGIYRNDCVCAENYNNTENPSQCVANAACTDNAVGVSAAGNSCICLRNHNNIADPALCVANVVCDAGYVRDAETDSCSCTENYNDVATPGTCEPDVVCNNIGEVANLETNLCVCDTGNRFVGTAGDCSCREDYNNNTNPNVCVLNTAPTCGEHQKLNLNRDTCLCNDNAIDANPDDNVVVCQLCGDNQESDGENVCVCKDGFSKHSNGVCMSQPECGINQEFSSEEDACVCQSGFVPDPVESDLACIAFQLSSSFLLTDSGSTEDSALNIETANMDAILITVLPDSSTTDNSADSYQYYKYYGSVAELSVTADGVVYFDNTPPPGEHHVVISVAAATPIAAVNVQNKNSCLITIYFSIAEPAVIVGDDGVSPSDSNATYLLVPLVGAGVYLTYLAFADEDSLQWTPSYSFYGRNADFSYLVANRWHAESDNWRFYWQTSYGNRQQLVYGSGLSYNSGIFSAALDSEAVEEDESALDLSLSANQIWGVWRLDGGYNFGLQMSTTETDTQNYLNITARYTLDRWILSATANTDGKASTTRLNYIYRF